MSRCHVVRTWWLALRSEKKAAFLVRTSLFPRLLHQTMLLSHHSTSTPMSTRADMPTSSALRGILKKPYDYSSCDYYSISAYGPCLVNYWLSADLAPFWCLCALSLLSLSRGQCHCLYIYFHVFPFFLFSARPANYSRNVTCRTA